MTATQANSPVAGPLVSRSRHRHVDRHLRLVRDEASPLVGLGGVGCWVVIGSVDELSSETASGPRRPLDAVARDLWR
ncbi:MAG: hypothetical protein QOK39_2524 [Acidimicrobiaceae bacterium]|nr:hypothetical protein [Acidimicrobiaceae bacterium]